MAKILTQYSAHANTIADTFRAAFVKTRLGECTVEMTAPEESTRGGLLGLQHATLRTPDGRSIVVGTVHAGDKRAELRSFSLVSRVHEERFKKAPPFGEADYKAFLAKAEPILGAFGLAITVTDVLAEPPAREPAESTPPPPPRSWLAWLVFLVTFACILAGGAYWALRT